MAQQLRWHPWLLPAGLFFCVLSVYLLTASSDLLHNGDTYLRYQTTQAIVDHGRLWIAHPEWTDTRVARGLGGHLYAFYGPGQTLLMVPLYIAGKVIAHHLALPYDVTTLYAARTLDLFLGALLALLMFFFAIRLGYSRAVGSLVSLIFAFATVSWPDAQSGLEQTPVNLFLLAAAYAIVTYLRVDDRERWLVGAGSAIGLALCTRYDAALYLVLLGAFIVATRFRVDRGGQGLREVSMYLLGVLPWIVLLGLWNAARFGSPFLTGLHEQTLGEPFLSGFLGLTVSPGKGLIWYLPLVFLLPWAVPAFARRQPLAASLFALFVLSPILFYSNILYWHGDPSWGPRYLYTAIPYLILPFAEIFAHWNRRSIILRFALGAFVLGSVGLEMAAVSVTQWRFWYRLEVTQQRASNVNTWTGQPFHWGASHYHYYWDLRSSPILIQLDDVYQVARIALGDTRYQWTARPDPYASNPADNYPINTAAFWWTDVRHPILGARTRDGIAGLLVLLMLLSVTGIGIALRSPSARIRQRKEHTSSLARTAGG